MMYVSISFKKINIGKDFREKSERRFNSFEEAWVPLVYDILVQKSCAVACRLINACAQDLQKRYVHLQLKGGHSGLILQSANCAVVEARVL